MNRPRTNTVLVVTFATLTFASFRVTISAADLEPFVTYSRSDALYYVGFASVLLMLWLQMALGLILGVLSRRVSVLWLLGVLWSIVGFLCVVTAVDTWTSDMGDHVFPVRASIPPATKVER